MSRALGQLVVFGLVLTGGWWIWTNSETITARLSGRQEVAALPTPAPESLSAVTALGRIEPEEIVRIAGPARFAVVVEELLVDEGDEVEAGQIIALLDTVATEEAEIAARQAELANAELELERASKLVADDVSAQSAFDQAQFRYDLAGANLRRAEAELERSRVRSPLTGRVLEVHCRAGERVGAGGIVEIADFSAVIAVAEVYETEIARIRVGQRAVVRSPALGTGSSTGTVRSIAAKVERKDLLDTDPVADADARIVEVEIALDDAAAAADLTNLRVDVTIDVGAPSEGR